jgi:hypothetical protein
MIYDMNEIMEKNKFVKIVPLNISEMFSEISLAY